MEIFGSSESVFINDKRVENQQERVRKWQKSLEVNAEKIENSSKIQKRRKNVREFGSLQ